VWIVSISMAISEDVRVVYVTNSPDEPLVDVPMDGKTIGEVWVCTPARTWSSP
jgi:hypothetical protein